MAEKKDEGSGGCLGMIGALILLALAAVFWGAAVAVAAAPLVFVWIMWSYKNSVQELEPLPENTGDFWLDNDEKARFAGLHETLARVQQEAETTLAQLRQKTQVVQAQAQQDEAHARARAQQEVDAAWARGEQLGLARNKDGSFNRRSRAGKEIAATLEQAPGKLDATLANLRQKQSRAQAELNAAEKEALDEIRHYQDKYEELARQPRQRWEALKTAYVRPQAAKMALLAYGTLGVALSLGYHVFWGSNLVRDVLIGSGLVSVVVYAVIARQRGEAFAERLPAPPLVNMNNLEQF